MRRIRLVVRPEEAGLSPSALAKARGGLSPSDAARLLGAGAFFVNRQRLKSDGPPLKLRDELVVYLEERGRTAGDRLPLSPSDIVYRDARIVVVDKPPGLAAQGTPGDARAGLDTAVALLLAKLGQPKARVGLVHRLDVETSGLCVLALDGDAVSALSKQFREGAVEKRYVAIVHGRPGFERIEVDAPLGPSGDRAGSQVVTPRGRPAKTTFTVRAHGSAPGFDWAVLEAVPHTGRTHQIRVHAQSLGLPLLGDPRYGGPAFHTLPDGTRLDFPRVALHAEALAFVDPDGTRRSFLRPLRDDLAAVQARLSAASSPASVIVP